jgi:hypothetical protein
MSTEGNKHKHAKNDKTRQFVSLENNKNSISAIAQTMKGKGKVVPVLNLVLCLEGVWGSGC